MVVKIINKSSNPNPQYATTGSAGMDICANEDAIIHPLERAIISTGLYIQLPDACEAQIRPRSGIAAKHGVTVLNAPGTIDADYTGEVKVILINLSEVPFVVNKGDRIAQIVFARYDIATLVNVEELEQTERGSGGFGSTGVSVTIEQRS